MVSIEKKLKKKYINCEINIDKIKKLYYNIQNRIDIEIFTIREYLLYKEKYGKNNTELNDTKEEYEITEIKNPHDKIFRKALDKKENAVQIINEFLEKEDKITKKDIEKYNSSYISNKLRNSEADIVYKMKNENVFFIIEHQTRIDYSMPYRMLKYEIEIIESVLIDEKEEYKNKRYEYPNIIPIVLYTGEIEWNAELDLRKIQLKWRNYKGMELSRYNVYDINKISNEKLLKEKSIINKIMLMEKARNKKEFIENLNKISKELKCKELKYTKEEKDFFIVAVKAIVQKQDYKEKVDEILNDIEEVENSMMQIIETLNRERAKLVEDSINQGKTEGIKEGRIEEKIQCIKNMLIEKIPIKSICRITGMTENEIKKISSKKSKQS